MNKKICLLCDKKILPHHYFWVFVDGVSKMKTIEEIASLYICEDCFIKLIRERKNGKNHKHTKATKAAKS